MAANIRLFIGIAKILFQFILSLVQIKWLVLPLSKKYCLILIISGYRLFKML